MACRNYEACVSLAHCAVAAAPGLATALVQVVLGGEPVSLLALNCLTYLAVCPKVCGHTLTHARAHTRMRMRARTTTRNDPLGTRGPLCPPA